MFHYLMSFHFVSNVCNESLNNLFCSALLNFLDAQAATNKMGPNGGIGTHIRSNNNRSQNNSSPMGHSHQQKGGCHSHQLPTAAMSDL